MYTIYIVIHKIKVKTNIKLLYVFPSSYSKQILPTVKFKNQRMNHVIDNCVSWIVSMYFTIWAKSGLILNNFMYRLFIINNLLDAPEAGRHNPSGTSIALEEKLYVNQQSCVP